MAIIEWNQGYSVQNSELDEQHKKLIELINLLHDQMKMGKGRESLNRVLTQLEEYTRTHFSCEEQWMERAGFSGLESHRKEHESLTRQVKELTEQHRAGKISLSLEVMLFLKDWLINHIQKSDKQYVSALNSL